MSAPIEDVIAALEGGGFDPRPTGKGYESRCPVHNGDRRNLTITESDDGRVLLHCHAHECPVEAIVENIGMEMVDLFPSDPTRNGNGKAKGNGKARGNGKGKKVHKTLVNARDAFLRSLRQPQGDKPADTTWAYRQYWAYHNAEGHIFYYVFRYENSVGEKTYRPAHAVPDGYVSGDPAGPLPLYHLPDIKESDCVYFLEGEKCADLVRRLKLVATTTAHGAKSPRRSDFQPLAGKEVIIVPDNDAPGEAYARTLMGLLAELDPRPTVRVVRLPVTNEGDDIAEWLESLPETLGPDEIRAELERLVDAAPLEDLGAAEPIPEAPDPPREPAEPVDLPLLEPGTWVWAHDRDPANIGRVVHDPGGGRDRMVQVHFVSPDGYEAEPLIPRSLLDGELTPGDATAAADNDLGFVSFVSDPPEAKPIRMVLRPVPQLVPEMIPDPLRPWLADIAERVGCPLDFPTVGALVALAVVVGRKLAIRPKRHDDWTVVPNLWGGIVGRPGVMKTPALTESTKPLRRLEFDARKRHEEAVREYQSAMLLAAVQADAAKKELKSAAKAKKPQAVLEALARDAAQVTAPAAPIVRRYTTSDPTVEALGELLRDNLNGIGLVRDELPGWLRSFDKDGRECDRAFYLEAWNGNGTTFTYDRIGRGTILIPSPCVSILGGMQPGPLRSLLRRVARGEEADDGLISRFQLLVWPDATSEWHNVDRWPDTAAKDRSHAIFHALDLLAPADVNATPDEDGGPPYLRFDPDAQDLFDAWRTDLEAKVRAPDETPLIESHLAKYRSLMPSLALLFHLVEVVDGAASGPVSPDAAELAAAWCDFLEEHARRVYEAGSERDPEPARRLAERLRKGDLPSPFRVREVVRKGWSQLDTPEAVERAVATLEDNGWLYGAEVPAGPSGGRPTVAYHVNPRVTGGEG